MTLFTFVWLTLKLYFATQNGDLNKNITINNQNNRYLNKSLTLCGPIEFLFSVSLGPNSFL